MPCCKGDELAVQTRLDSRNRAAPPVCPEFCLRVPLACRHNSTLRNIKEQSMSSGLLHPHKGRSQDLIMGADPTQRGLNHG